MLLIALLLIVSVIDKCLSVVMHSDVWVSAELFCLLLGFFGTVLRKMCYPFFVRDRYFKRGIVSDRDRHNAMFVVTKLFCFHTMLDANGYH